MADNSVHSKDYPILRKKIIYFYWNTVIKNILKSKRFLRQNVIDVYLRNREKHRDTHCALSIEILKKSKIYIFVIIVTIFSHIFTVCIQCLCNKSSNLLIEFMNIYVKLIETFLRLIVRLHNTWAIHLANEYSINFTEIRKLLFIYHFENYYNSMNNFIRNIVFTIIIAFY